MKKKYKIVILRPNLSAIHGMTHAYGAAEALTMLQLPPGYTVHTLQPINMFQACFYDQEFETLLKPEHRMRPPETEPEPGQISTPAIVGVLHNTIGDLTDIREKVDNLNVEGEDIRTILNLIDGRSNSLKTLISKLGGDQ